MNMNIKGFTLVELLAMMVVLGIIIGVAVPNIMGIMAGQKVNIIKNDVEKMVEASKVKMSTDKTITKPTDGKCIVFALNNLNDNQDIEAGPNGGEYKQYESFVVVKRSGSRYEYYTRLVEEVKANDYFGVDGVEINALTDDSVGKVTLDSSLELEGEQSDITKINSILSSKGISCTLDKYYPGYKLPSS